jgi:hypothetical protein
MAGVSPETRTTGLRSCSVRKRPVPWSFLKGFKFVGCDAILPGEWFLTLALTMHPCTTIITNVERHPPNGMTSHHMTQLSVPRISRASCFCAIRVLQTSDVHRILLGGGSKNSVEDRGQRERGSTGGSSLVRGSTQFTNE